MRTLLTALFLFTGLLQDQSNIIYWSENTRLVWNDFRGPAENHPTHKAMTRAGLSSNALSKGDSLIFRSLTMFDKTKSWVKVGSLTPEILQHEQLHFDLTELLNRKVKKAVKMKGSLSKRNFNQIIGDIMKEMQDQNHKDQIQYDQESYTSMDKQIEWNARIAAELKALDEFKGPSVSVLFTN